MLTDGQHSDNERIRTLRFKWGVSIQMKDLRIVSLKNNVSIKSFSSGNHRKRKQRDYKTQKFGGLMWDTPLYAVNTIG